MPTITIRNLPSVVHARLERRAKVNRRSLNGEIIDLLTASVDKDQDRKALIERIDRRRQIGTVIKEAPEVIKRKARERIA